MDVTKKPLVIPPEFFNYAEKKGLFHLLQYMIEELLVVKPDNPLEHLIKILDDSHNEHAPRAIIYGPPASGQYTISKALARKIRAVHIEPLELLHPDYNPRDPPPILEFADGDRMAQLIFDRIQQTDCKTKGFILDGYPRTRKQALQLQAHGVVVTHLIHIKTTNTVLLDRYSGKRIDPITGDVYHLVFKPPTDQSVVSRLIEVPGGLEHNMHTKLKLYSANVDGIESCYDTVSKVFDADQPEGDIISQVKMFLQRRLRSLEPHIPRVVLIGPTGVGKSWQAAHLSSKYHLVDVDVNILVRQELVCGSQLGQQLKTFVDQQLSVPDEMLMKVVSNRLCQFDCTTRGWIIHGFPQSREHAELLTDCGHSPNRVFIITASVDVIKERISWKRVDPITGERYHLLYNPPQDLETKEHLVIHPDDTEEQIDVCIAEYNSNITDIDDYYQNICVHVNGEHDPYVVMEMLESYIVNPLPKKSP